MARPISTEHATGTSVCPPFARRVICEASGSLRYCSFNGFWSDRISMATSFLYSRLFFVDGDSLGQVVGQLHEATRKTHEPERTRRITEALFSGFPSCTFVSLVVNGFTSRPTTFGQAVLKPLLRLARIDE